MHHTAAILAINRAQYIVVHYRTPLLFDSYIGSVLNKKLLHILYLPSLSKKKNFHMEYAFASSLDKEVYLNFFFYETGVLPSHTQSSSSDTSQSVIKQLSL